jgi:hypothetical protein
MWLPSYLPSRPHFWVAASFWLGCVLGAVTR